jgi:hypothetical protein
MTTDRELLKLAAKAAGIKGLRYVKRKPIQGGYRTGLWSNLYEYCWNPLSDSGDALRLAVKLRLRLSTVCNDGNASVASATDMYLDAHVEEHNGDPCAATRRAIVRAAAEIGKAMP